MIYEVINPSDAVTFECADPFVAALACILLGNGFYGLKDEKGDTVCPILAFGGEEAVGAWLAEQGKGKTADDLRRLLTENRPAIAEALSTCMVADLGERAGLVAAMKAGGGDMKAAIAALNESRRTSMNNICARAAGLAASLCAAGAATSNTEGAA